MNDPDRTSASDAPKPFHDSLRWRLFDTLTRFVDQRRGWYRLPTPLGLLTLIGIRDVLRRKNLYDTTGQPAVNPVHAPAFSTSVLTERSADGSWNDLEHPDMGM